MDFEPEAARRNMHWMLGYCEKNRFGELHDFLTLHETFKLLLSFTRIQLNAAKEKSKSLGDTGHSVFQPFFGSSESLGLRALQATDLSIDNDKVAIGLIEK